MKDKIILGCEKHGEFEVEAQKFIYRQQGCPKCAIASHVSKPEQELADYIKSLGVEVIQNDRSLIAPQEIDILIPSHNLAIEYNGLYWHTEQQGKDKQYHKNKTLACKEKGYQLIHIFEDTYKYNKDKILSHLKYRLGKRETKSIYARKCEIRKIEVREANKFLDTYHIQGSVRQAFLHLGLFHNNKLVSVTSFKKGQSNTKNKGSFELIRHATSGSVVGSLGKAVKYFAKNISPKIFTFCDDSFFSGASYLNAGFKETSKIEPDYMYVVGDTREHKFKWRLKDIKEKLGIEGMTEREAMEHAEIPRVYDGGKTRYDFII